MFFVGQGDLERALVRVNELDDERRELDESVTSGKKELEEKDKERDDAMAQLAAVESSLNHSATKAIACLQLHDYPAEECVQLCMHEPVLRCILCNTTHTLCGHRQSRAESCA